tara:strand:- start:580 stop:858 length:279 start_codon:yes stop_codon:yes gene_type:complete
MTLDNIFNIFGYIGAGFLSVMMIPQVYLTVKSNKTQDLSVKFLFLNLTAIGFMLPYSIYFRLYPILITNCSVGICNAIILIYALRNKISENN